MCVLQKKKSHEWISIPQSFLSTSCSKHARKARVWKLRPLASHKYTISNLIFRINKIYYTLIFYFLWTIWSSFIKSVKRYIFVRMEVKISRLWRAIGCSTYQYFFLKQHNRTKCPDFRPFITKLSTYILIEVTTV